MLCAVCGLDNPEHANFCLKCGSAFAAVSEVAVVGVPHTILTDAPAASFYYPSSISKVFLLSALSSGIYSAFWFWKQWRAEDPNDGRAWTLFRTILSGFFFYGMAREVQEEAWRREVKCRYSPVMLTALLWLCALTVRYGPDAAKFAAIWLGPIPLTMVQMAINRINVAVAQGKPAGWRTWQIALATVLALVWVLALFGLLLGPDSSTSTENV
jgi:hypothetical protein